MTEPSALPIWDINETNTDPPGGTRESDGWIYTLLVPEKAPAEIWNYWMNNVYKWITHLEIRSMEGNNFIDTGSANAYDLASGSPVNALVDGMVVAFTTANQNTAASTADVDGLGALDIRLPGGSVLVGSEIRGNNHQNYIKYNSSSGRWVLITNFNYSDENNTIIGLGAGSDLGVGTNNTFAGILAGANATSGDDNVCLGLNSGVFLTTADLCTFVGANAGFSHISGDGNVAIGSDSGSNITIETGNTFLGPASGFGIIGDDNIAIGRNSGFGAIVGTDNIFIGVGAGSSATSSAFSIAIGTGANGTGVGGEYSVTIGNQAGVDNISDYVVFIGANAGNNNENGEWNVFIGFESGFNNTTADGNTYVGYESGYSNITSNNNTYIGGSAGYSNISNHNTFIGYRAGYSSTSSGSGVFVGYLAGDGVTTGDENVFLGDRAGNIITTGSRNICIGSESGSTQHLLAGDDDKFVLANSSSLIAALIMGNFSTGEVVFPNGGLTLHGDLIFDHGLTIEGGGEVNCSYNTTSKNLRQPVSSKRFKTNINYENIDSDWLLKLKPVTCNMKNTYLDCDGKQAWSETEFNPTTILTLIAEDCDEVHKGIATYEFDGTVLGVRYGQAEMETAIIHKVIELHAKDIESQKKIDDLQERLERLESTLML